jgi:CheY-like chemotaxis protein
VIPNTPTYPLPPMRVLVVDDESDTRATLRVMLNVWGHRVCEAATADQALELAGSFQPDVVLLDLVLPGLDGLDLAVQLRRLPGLERTAMVALTGHPSEDKRQQAYESGVRHFLVKPADPVLLRGLLGSIRYPDRG